MVQPPGGARRRGPSAAFDEILKGEAGKREDDKETEGDRVELPALLEAIAGARFEQEAERADREILHDHFGDADPGALLRRLERHDDEEPLVQERQRCLPPCTPT